MLRLGLAIAAIYLLTGSGIAAADSASEAGPCSSGSAVKSPQDNPLLVQDCMALLEGLLPGSGARPLLKDDETGSTWMALTGLAIDGPLKGAALERVASHLSFWFAWNDWNPATDLYQPPGA